MLGTLAARAGAAGDHLAAIAWARRAVALDALSEQHVRVLMRRLAAAGDGEAALAVFARLEDRLARELGVGPSAATRAVADEIRAASTAPRVKLGAEAPARAAGPG